MCIRDRFNTTSGELDPGETITITIVAEVDPNAAGAVTDANGNLVNQATAGGTDPDGTPVTDPSDDPTNSTNSDPDANGNPDDPTVFTPQQADLVTVKTLVSGDDTPAEGDTVTFEITVTNDGGDVATNVSLLSLIHI